MSPLTFLLIILTLTTTAVVLQAGYRFRLRRALSKLAEQWRMHYAANDRFRLAGRVAQELPEPGAADVRVRDVLYDTEGDAHRYLLTAEYTAGVVRSKKRHRQVCTLRESKTRAGEFTPMVLAPRELTILEQYRTLHHDAAE
ncbi:MAG: hypothetical protein ACREIT_09270 [Tepidisphaeraceae bacterium]